MGVRRSKYYQARSYGSGICRTVFASDALDRRAHPFGEHGRLYQVAELTPETLARFAALVRNATLEECASEFEGQYTDSCPGTKISAAILAMKEQA